MVTRNTRAAPDQSPPDAAGPQSHDGKDDLSIVYPSSDGEPMAESELQWVPLTDTVITLKSWFAQRSDVYVAGDMLVYYRMNDNRTRVAPDVYVVFGAAGNHPRHSWLVWREGKAPDFVMEIASPSTWERDAAEKREIYARMGVREYWRFDPTGECFTPELIGETLVESGYRELALERDGEGRLGGRSAVLGLGIYVLPGLELRLYDPQGGKWLLTPRENEEARLAAEEARLAAEQARLTAEEARLAAEEALRESRIARQQIEAENERLREKLRSRQSGQ